MRYKIKENNIVKVFRSKPVSYLFNKVNGTMITFGPNRDTDAEYSPFGPFISDIEITTICNNGCPYCYKSNTSVGKNMSLDTFKNLITKINVNNTLTQVAFGLGATGEENPDLWDMCRYLRSIGVIPNGTVASISDETAGKIASLFGACAISYHGDKDKCYNSVKRLTDRGLTQTNIHIVIYSENFDEVMSVFKDIKTDPRLSGLNAIVMLSLKQKGRAVDNKFTTLTQDKFNELAQYLLGNEIRFGMDSCSSHKYISFLTSTTKLSEEEKKSHLECIEPCESFAIFSSYFNVDGLYYPCSFAEGSFEGINVLDCNNFVDDIWNGQVMTELRNKSLEKNRECLIYKI